jgi:hypothetical protein
VDFADRIASLKSMKAELAKQLAAFDPPILLRTPTGHQETIEETKVHIRRCIAQIDELMRHYGADRG